MPKFKNLSSALGWEAEPDNVEEGIFLQPEEATTIDNALAFGNTAVTSLETANTRVTELEGEVTTLNTAANQNTTTIGTQAARIIELEAENVRLGGQSSGPGTVVTAPAVDQPATSTKKTGALPRFDSPDHPANQAAARQGRGGKPE